MNHIKQGKAMEQRIAKWLLHKNVQGASLGDDGEQLCFFCRKPVGNYWDSGHKVKVKVNGLVWLGATEGCGQQETPHGRTCKDGFKEQ